jgi:hypothetical protein
MMMMMAPDYRRRRSFESRRHVSASGTCPNDLDIRHCDRGIFDELRSYCATRRTFHSIRRLFSLS